MRLRPGDDLLAEALTTPGGQATFVPVQSVILPRTDRAAATEIAKRLQASVQTDPLPASGQELRLPVSCGLASFPEDTADVNALLRQADGRMYAAKAARYGASRKRRA